MKGRMWFVVCALWTLCVCASVCAGARPAAVALRRCCAAGERLAAGVAVGAAVSLSGWRCERGAGSASGAGGAGDELWLPRVYAPARRSYLERGQVPAHWTVQEHAPPATCAEPRALVDDHTVPYVLVATNGSLLLRREGLALPPPDFCVEAGGALACGAGAASPSPGAVAVKCCAAGHALEAEGRARCVPAAGADAVADAALGSGTALGGAWPACEGGRYAVVGTLRAGTVRADGSLALGEGALPAGEWCAEGVRGEGGGARVLACEGVRAEAAGRHALYGAGLAVGAAFLAATLAAGWLVPAAHHALHWRCQTHYVAALLLADVLLAVTQLAGDAVPPTLCKVLAVCMHFLFLSAFFWLNTMCFNIWWTFRDFRPTSLERGQEACRLRVYRVYAWGGPLAVAGAGALLDALPEDGGGGGLLRPRFGVRRCWFYGDMEMLVYFFGPVGVLLAVNLALFASTARQLTCGLWRRDELKATTERAALGRVCAKLVVVMGITWGADLVSWAVGGPHYLWYATDLLNALQGVFIFVVVGCQPAVWAAAKRGWARVRRGGRWGGGGGDGGCGGEAGGAASASAHLPSCGDSLTHTTAAPTPAPAPPRAPLETVC